MRIEKKKYILHSVRKIVFPDWLMRTGRVLFFTEGHVFTGYFFFFFSIVRNIRCRKYTRAMGKRG